MEYLIAKIEPKSEYVRNKYYPMMVGRECDILFLAVQRGAVLLVDMLYDPGHPHRFFYYARGGDSSPGGRRGYICDGEQHLYAGAECEGI